MLTRRSHIPLRYDVLLVFFYCFIMCMCVRMCNFVSYFVCVILSIFVCVILSIFVFLCDILLPSGMINDDDDD